jgi:hypothetical protein
MPEITYNEEYVYSLLSTSSRIRGERIPLCRYETAPTSANIVTTWGVIPLSIVTESEPNVAVTTGYDENYIVTDMNVVVQQRITGHAHMAEGG